MTILDRNQNLSQRMLQALGRSIISGEYNDDEPLPTEAELCEKFGVSRSAVREAIKMLLAKGMINSRPRQGIRILPENQWNIFDPDLLRWMLESNPTKALLTEFFQLRIAIEPESASLAARFGTPTQVAEIGKALDRMRLATPYSEESLQADIDLHVSILFASNNRFYIRLRDFIQTALRVSISHTAKMKADQESIIAEHDIVYQAIKNKDPVEARRCMTNLVADALNFIERDN